jgi:formylglycine-generating enzyme required for sulfatase activity
MERERPEIPAGSASSEQGRRNIPQLLEHLSALGFSAHRHPETGALAMIPPLCVVPEGSFLMGSDPTRDPWAQPREQPQHTVWLPTFHIARYPVTVAEYACALAAGSDGMEEPVNWEKQRSYLTHPVASLTWYDAQAYTVWLSEATGFTWRLPTETEWEKAARGTDGRVYPWGDAWDPERANWDIYERFNAFGQPPPEIGKTAIDAYPLGASPYGLRDMVGNVCEWLSTIHDDADGYPYTPNAEREDVARSARFRMQRGGCCLYDAKHLRIAYRDAFSVDDRFDWLQGLRLVFDGGPDNLRQSAVNWD